MNRHSVILHATLLLVFAAACSSKPAPAPDAGDAADASETPAPRGPLALDAVALEYTPAPVASEVPSADDVNRRARATLLGQPEFVDRGQPGSGPWSLSGSWRAAAVDPRDGSEQILGNVYVKMTLKTSARPAPPAKARYTAEAFVGEALPDGTPPGEALRGLVFKVVEETALNLAKQVRVDHADDQALVALLQTDDAELLGFAIPAVRERRLTDAAPRLITLLQHPDRETVNRAAAALGDVGDTKAVSPLIDAGSRVEPLDRLPILYALGELGGPEATLYLETLVGGTSHPQVKAAAENALRRIKEKKTP